MAVKELKYLLKHSSVYGIGTIFAQAAGFLLLPFYTNYLTPHDYGVAALVETSISIIAMVASLGLSQSVTRFYSEGKDEKDKKIVITTTYVITWLICIICIPILFFLSIPLSELLFHKPEYGRYFMLSSIAMFVGFNVEIGFNYLVLKARSTLYVILSLLNTVTLIAFNVYFIAFQRSGLIGLFYSTLITKVLFSILLTIPILTIIKLKFSPRLGLRMIKFSIPLGFATMFRIFTNESDKFFINHFFSPIETGIYGVAGKIATSVHILITTTFLQSYQPIRFEIAKDANGPRTYGAIFEHYLLAIGSFGLLISIFSNDIIRLLTTKAFYPAAAYIPPLILTWIFFGMKYHLENGILISMKPRYISYISGASSFTNVALNFILIPRWGIWGAIISSNISNIILVGASFFISQKLYRIHIELVKIVKIITCLSVCFTLSILASKLSLSLAILVKIVLFIMYCVSIFTLRIVELEVFTPIKNRLFQSDESSAS